jgi:sodium/pantothenate symporter
LTLAWSLFIVYLIGTAWLGWLGFRKTTGFGTFAVGDRAMNPFVVGIILAASVSSASTFIINPGFIFVDGFSAYFHFVIAVAISFIAMLSVLSFRFRRIGAEYGALTIPDWIGKRYGSRRFALFFSVLNLLSFAFIVLLVGGISIVMQSLLGISNAVALLITLTFVTGYVFIGGTYAHVLTNLLQGGLMILVTLAVLASCVWIAYQQPGSTIDALRAIDANLVAPINENGKLFNDAFSIYVAGFVVGAIIVCQPHILTKALYVKDDRAVKVYLVVFAVVFVLFQLLGTVGFFAHLVVPDAALIDAATGQFRQDLVMTMYLKTVFPEAMFTFVGIVLLAAAMSTLDGLLVSISTITAARQAEPGPANGFCNEGQSCCPDCHRHCRIPDQPSAAEITRHIWAGGCLWTDRGNGRATADGHFVSRISRIAGLAGFHRRAGDSLWAVFQWRQAVPDSGHDFRKSRRHSGNCRIDHDTTHRSARCDRVASIVTVVG